MARVEGAAKPTTAPDGWPEKAARFLYLLVTRVFSIAVLLAAWEILARSGTFTPFQLPALSAVLERIGTDAWSGDLAINTALTLYRALVAFLICAVGGVAIGMAMSRNVVANWFFDPIVSVGFPMPKIAFLPVVILWLGVLRRVQDQHHRHRRHLPGDRRHRHRHPGRGTRVDLVGAQHGRQQSRTADPDRAAGGAAADHDRACRWRCR